MVYNSKEIVAELNSRRDEYRRKRRRRLAAGASIAAVAVVAALALIVGTSVIRVEPYSAQAGSPAPLDTAKATQIPREDRIFESDGPAEGWYYAPLEGTAEKSPSTVSVYTNSRGVRTVCNITDSDAITHMLSCISMLEPDNASYVVPDNSDSGLVVVFTYGRRVFRMESLPDGRYLVNDRGCFRLPEEASDSFPRFVEASAQTAISKATSVLLSFGGEPITAFTTFTDP